MELDYDHIRRLIEDKLGSNEYDLDMLSCTLIELVDQQRINIYEATQYLLDTEGSDELCQIFLDYPRFMWWFPDGMVSDILDVPDVNAVMDRYLQEVQDED